MKNKPELFNKIIDHCSIKSYLEIGLGKPHPDRFGNYPLVLETFKEIKCDFKTGVDPHPEYGKEKYIPQNVYNEYSDTFFDYNDRNFGFIFIDGAHEHHQVKRDILNSLDCLEEGGIIAVHDVAPFAPEQIDPNANGTAYRAWMDLVTTRPDLNFFTYFFNDDFDSDAVGFIVRAKSKPVPQGTGPTVWLQHVDQNDRSFMAFEKNKAAILSVKKLDEIMKILQANK